jgi:hypothetical protein
MAAKRSKRSPSEKKADLERAAKFTGLSVTKVKEIDAKQKEKNKKPLSLLANLAIKAEKNVPKLVSDVARLAADGGVDWSFDKKKKAKKKSKK